MFAWLSRWFLNAVREGTMMGHIVEHVALELQELGC